MEFLGIDKKPMEDPAIRSIVVEARTKLGRFADPSWLDHSPELFKGMEATLELIAARRKRLSKRSHSTTASPTLPSTSPVPPSMPLLHPALFVPTPSLSPSQAQAVTCGSASQLTSPATGPAMTIKTGSMVSVSAFLRTNILC